MRWVVVWMVGMGIGLVGVGDLRAEPPAVPLAYAVFGLDGVSLAAKERIEGDVGASAGDVSVGQGTRVTGAVAAASIRLRRKARAGAYYCAEIAGKSETCSPMPSPLVDPASLLLVQVASGGADISLSKRAKQTTPLAPGAYGALDVGTKSQLVLAGGDYSFASVAIGTRAKVTCAAACTIGIRRKLAVRRGAQFGAGADVDPGDVLVNVQSDGETTAVDVKSRATIAGSIYAPTGLVKLGAAGTYDGAFVGQSVRIGPRARLTGPGGT